MSASHLPEDLQRWPRDPYALLGVKFGVSTRELRRVYTGLIRVYKPEQFPDHFRRIRDAYEQVLTHSRLFGAGSAEPGPGPEDRTAEPAREEAGADEAPVGEGADESTLAAEETWTAPFPGLSLADELDELWERACTGDEAAVYRRLVELAERPAGQADICLRLYWLLEAMPELDPERPPCDWLARGLAVTGWSGPLRELYRRVAADDPAEALGERCTRLLLAADKPAAMTDLVECRWQAAGRSGEWQVIEGDLRDLRERVVRDDEAAWLRLLLAAADQAAWATEPAPRKLLADCQRDIEKLVHLSIPFENELARFDFLLKLAEGYQSLRRKGDAELADLVRRSWLRPFEEVRPSLMTYLARLTAAPRRALAELDCVVKTAPAVLAQFKRLLGWLEGSLESVPEDTRTREDQAQLASRFLQGRAKLKYATFRRECLDFCLREALAPRVVAGLVESEELAKDVALACVYEGWRLFWT